MNVIQEMKNRIKEYYDFNNEELEFFFANPRNVEALSIGWSYIAKKTMIVEVIESSRCTCQHNVGDKFYFDGTGNLLTRLSPKKTCIYALIELYKLIHSAMELTFAGIDPNKMLFKQVGCFDVGLKCGGVGHIAMELRVEDRK